MNPFRRKSETPEPIAVEPAAPPAQEPSMVLKNKNRKLPQKVLDKYIYNVLNKSHMH